MVQSRSFVDRVLRHPEFTHRIVSMVIDEAHCLSHWGANFRKKYASLGATRAFLPRGTPVIAVTAALTARVHRDLVVKLNFPQNRNNYIFRNVGNDRPNVSIVVRSMEHPQNTFADLDFILPTTVETIQDIPKTYLYVDDIEAGSKIIDYLTAKLAKLRPEMANTNIPIRPFNATLSDESREHAMQEFALGRIRI